MAVKRLTGKWAYMGPSLSEIDDERDLRVEYTPTRKPGVISYYRTLFIVTDSRREKIVWDAQRLESPLFSGYDPNFEGDEPPRL